MAPTKEAPDSLDVSELRHALQIKTQELASETILRDVKIICEQEETRRIRVRLLLLEDENDDLRDQLAQDDDRIDELERSLDDLRAELDEREADLQRAQTDLRAKTRESDTLKAELEALNSVSADSTKLLTEKLALVRELSNLKPELDHLRSQAASHQSALSEKLALQRQLSTLQVSLEEEKRASQRVLAKEGKSSQADAKIEGQLEELRKELAKEKREREKAERETKKISSEWEGKKEILEGKLEAFRNKLRSTKDQLKESQSELQKAQAAAVTRNAQPAESDELRKPTRNPRKRPMAQMDTDATFGTPGGAVLATKRGRRASAQPGDKSTFSITPFLNRTASIAPQSSPEPQKDEDGDADAERPATTVEDENDRAVHSRSPSVMSDTQSLPFTRVSTQKGRPLSTARSGKGNASTAHPRNRRLPSMLEKVTEEDNEENVPPALESNPTAAVPATKAKKPPLSFASILAEDVEPKKKKRKLLSAGPIKTLFDDDDAEATKTAAAKSLFGGPKGFAALGRGLGGPKGIRKGGLGAGTGELAIFSPLKKDKRAVAGP
ncbi:MAG: hypothetical protein M1819_001000 [Sarea resinae]|nr:MAG: hypothetical protein M1819_001000 [Sarea resinae]